MLVVRIPLLLLFLLLIGSHNLLKQKNFLVFYKERKMIIRTAFAKYLEVHPDLRRRC